jgi:hypothetical protein
LKKTTSLSFWVVTLLLLSCESMAIQHTYAVHCRMDCCKPGIPPVITTACVRHTEDNIELSSHLLSSLSLFTTDLLQLFVLLHYDFLQVQKFL